jgi:hypothetical protein
MSDLVAIKRLEIQLEGLHDAAKRGRWVFALAVGASLVIIGGAWNQYFSWLSGIAARAAQQEFPKADELSWTAYMKQEQVKGWVDSMFIKVPVLGLNTSVADNAVLGTGALLVITVWLFMCLRRENHLLVRILHSADEASIAFRELAYYGALGTQVFATSSLSDAPMGGPESRGRRDRIIKSMGVDRQVTSVLLSTMMLLPAISSVAIIAAEAWSLATTSPFREGLGPLWKQLDGRQQFQAVCELAIGVIASTLTLAYSLKCEQMQTANSYELRRSREHLRVHPEQIQAD